MEYVLIEQKATTEVLNLFLNELVELIHHLAEDADTVLPDVVNHLLHANCLKLLCVRCFFVEKLCVQIVVVVCDVLLRFSH